MLIIIIIIIIVVVVVVVVVVNYLKLNNQVLPSVEINGTFQYLGKQFSYKMETDKVENDLQSTSYLGKTEILTLHPKIRYLQ